MTWVSLPSNQNPEQRSGSRKSRLLLSELCLIRALHQSAVSLVHSVMHPSFCSGVRLKPELCRFDGPDTEESG